MSNKLLRVMGIAKIGAWIAFSCLSVLIILFPFVGMALALKSMFDETPVNAYIGLAAICVIYLALFFLFQFLVAVYPWWRSRKIITRTLIAVVSVALIVGITVPPIVIQQRNNYSKVTNHFEVNWKINPPNDAKLKFDKSKSYGFVGGHDKLAYAVFKLNSSALDSEMLKLVPNEICNFKINWLKKDFPNLSDKIYAKIYFEQLLNDFQFKIPKRFIPDWNDGEMLWGLHGKSNSNDFLKGSCLFVVFTPNTKQLILFEFLPADH
jgi:hypothetical protein